MPRQERERPPIGFGPERNRPLGGHEDGLRDACLVHLLLEHGGGDVQRELHALGNDDVAVLPKRIELAAEFLVGVLQPITKAGLGINLPVADEVVGLAVLLFVLVAAAVLICPGRIGLHVPLQILTVQAKLGRHLVNRLNAFACGPADVFKLVRVGVPHKVVD